MSCSSYSYLDQCGCDPAINYCPITASASDRCPPSTLMPDGMDCHIRIPCAGGTAVVGSGGACWKDKGSLEII